MSERFFFGFEIFVRSWEGRAGWNEGGRMRGTADSSESDECESEG